jgi:hypothetical protein
VVRSTIEADAPPNPDALRESSLTLALGRGGELVASRSGRSVTVSVRQAFPWSHPGRYLSLRDADEKEFAFVADAVALDESSRSALLTAVASAGFVLEITRVVSIEEEVEVRHWSVHTRQGARTFQTRLDDWPRELPDGGLLVRDVAGDLYRVPDPEGLDEESRRLLWAFVD